jgi:hypothetical protein
MEDWQQKEFDPPEGGPDPGQWQVHIGLDPGDAHAIRRFGPQVIPAETFEIYTELEEGGAEGEVVLAIRVLSDTAPEAVAEATWKLNKIRGLAGLERQPAVVLGYISPSWRRNAAASISKEAIALLQQNRDALAVIRAQTACELFIAKAFDDLLKDKFPAVTASKILRRPTNLSDEYSRELLLLLTGELVQQSPWWSAYSSHQKRRNAIVHKGITISHEDAMASIETMNNLNEWLLRVCSDASPFISPEQLEELASDDGAG